LRNLKVKIMTRQPHDQFAKEYLEELLKPLGKVERSKEISGEVRQIDIWFIPDKNVSVESSGLGLLAKMAQKTALFEPYRNTPTETEIKSCLLKLYSIHSLQEREAKREKFNLDDDNLPFLWILAPTFSERMLKGFGATLDVENWENGIYFLPDFLKTALVAINQLPKTNETLWLRVLGKGTTQKLAVEELIELPKNSPYRRNLMDILASWRKNLEIRTKLTSEEREDFMNLSPAYLKEKEEWRIEGELKGKLEGKLEGKLAEKRAMIENFLLAKFGNLDIELTAIIEPLLQVETPEVTRVLLHYSKEELIARFLQS
jgi:hypothetical protein